MLSVDEIKQLLQKGEGTRVEFKEAQNGIPDNFYDSVVAFLNKEGGIILLGVTDGGDVLGLNGANLMQLKQDIVTVLNNPDVINPPMLYPLEKQIMKGRQFYICGCLLVHWYINMPGLFTIGRMTVIFELLTTGRSARYILEKDRILAKLRFTRPFK